MSIFSTNSFSELLLRFMENDLPEPQQEALFGELARNSALREELSQHILIAKTVQESLPTPPAHIRESLLASLSSADSLVPQVRTSAIDAHSITTNILLSLTGFVAGVALMLVTGIILQYNALLPILSAHTVPSSSAKPQSLAQVIEPTPLATTLAITEPHSPLFSQTPNSETSAIVMRGSIQRGHTTLSKHHSVQQLPVHTNTQSLQEQEAVSSIAQDAAAQQAIPENFTSLSATILTVSPVQEVPLLAQKQMERPLLTSPFGSLNSEPTLPALPPQELLGAQIEVRGFIMRSFPSFELPGLIRPPVNNMALALRWQLNEQWAIGAEGGQETLLQRFTTLDDTTTKTLQQNYLALWGGLNAQWNLWANPSRSFLSFTPFLRATIGSSSMGPMLRVGGGTLVSIGSYADLLLLGEASSFAYTENSRWYSTEKAGLSFGIQVHF